MTDDNLNPLNLADAAILAKRAAAMHRATSELLEVMLLDLPQDKHRALNSLLASGGRVGIEATTNGDGETRLCMIGFNGAGERLVLSTVTASTNPGRH